MRELFTPDGAWLEALHTLERECFAQPMDREQLGRQLRDASRVFTACREGETLLGAADYQFVLDEGYIGNVAVTASARRQGIGRALVEELLRRAREQELSFLTLEVRQSNAPARALYESCGFVTVGSRRSYYEKPTEDAILMTAYFGSEAEK